MTNRAAVITELRDWACITGQPLPYVAEVIADLEARGFCVDLADGAVFWAAELLDARVSLTEAGWAAYAGLGERRVVLDEMERQAVR
jgi:hypothetical protein